MDFNAVITTDQYPKDAHDEDTKKNYLSKCPFGSKSLQY